MSAKAQGLQLLMQLVHEPPSDNRRDLLVHVISQLLSANALTSRENDMLDEIVDAIASNLEQPVRLRLSTEIATSPIPMQRTARRMACDVIDVALPVLQSPTALSPLDLYELAGSLPQPHLWATEQRDDGNERLSERLAQAGGDAVAIALLDNPSSKIAHETYERLADRSGAAAAIGRALIRRASVPLDILAFIYWHVGAAERVEIIARFQDASDADVADIKRRPNGYLTKAYRDRPRDYNLAKPYVEGMAARGALHPSSLEGMLCENKLTSFVIGLAWLTGIDFELAHRFVERKDLDAIAILYRASNFGKASFAPICILFLKGGAGVSKAREYAGWLERTPVDLAQRAARVWKIRMSRDLSSGDA